MNNRHAFRAVWHDYGNGLYFVTICTHEKRHLFGVINDGRMIPTSLGKIVEDCITKTPQHYPYIEIWNHVVMPNHIHMVIAVDDLHNTQRPGSSATNRGCLKPPKHGDSCEDFHHNSKLAIVVGALKAAVTRIAHKKEIIAPTPSTRIWQRLFHEHIISNQHTFDNIMNYIDNNVANWCKDCFYQ